MPQFKNLVFEGGGVKGIAYAGALEVLQKEAILPEIQRVAGTSAGAITAALVALGADSEKVAQIVGGTHFREFMDDSFGVVRDVDRLLHDYGWFKGDAFSDWMQKQVFALTQDKDLTFGELAVKAKDPATASGRFKELFVIGSNLTLQTPMIYSAEQTPDLPIWEAVRISMSIPLFFACVRQQSQVLVDGGVTWNYPLDLFDDLKYVDAGAPDTFSKPASQTVYDENHIYNKQTLGLRVDTQDEIAAEKEGWHLPPAKINDFFDYLKAVVGFMNDMANKLHLHQNDWHRTIALDASGVRATDFDLSGDLIEKLRDNGRAGATQYFAWFNDPNASPAPINRVVS